MIEGLPGTGKFLYDIKLKLSRKLNFQISGEILTSQILFFSVKRKVNSFMRQKREIVLFPQG